MGDWVETPPDETFYGLQAGAEAPTMRAPVGQIRAYTDSTQAAGVQAGYAAPTIHSGLLPLAQLKGEVPLDAGAA